MADDSKFAERTLKLKNIFFGKLKFCDIDNVQVRGPKIEFPSNFVFFVGSVPTPPPPDCDPHASVIYLVGFSVPVILYLGYFL